MEKIPTEVCPEDGLDATYDDSYDPFAEAYLSGLNESVHSMSPEKIRERSTEILAHRNR
jgi:hypothetical protein